MASKNNLQAKAKPGNIFKSLKTPVVTLLHIIYCFFVLYLSLAIFLIPILIMIVYRFILSVVFFVWYKRKYKLMESANACFGVDRFANVMTLFFYCYIDGPCDIEVLQKRINKIFTTFKDKNGSRPYEVMLCGLVRKFGFFCWENMRDSFDINHHIRYFPGCSDPNRVYSESELFEAAMEIADDVWDDSRPKWEFLVIPKLRRDDTGEVCSAIHFRLHHAYVDGISAAQIIRLCVVDKPAPKFVFDPVNAPILPKPWWMKLIILLQVIFLGPWASLKFMTNSEDNVFIEGPLTGGKFTGRTKLDISVESMRKIRKFYGCSTTAIQHYAITGAMKKLALSKGYSVPDEMLGSLPFAMLPVPNEYPQNHVGFGIYSLPVAGQGLERLSDANKVCARITHPMNYYALLTSRLFMQITGLFPTSVVEKSMGSLKLTYYVSNVPGIKDSAYFNGNKLLNVFGTGPVVNGIRYGVGVTCYDDKFSFGFLVEKSKLIGSRKDLNYLIEEFENEIKFLMGNVHAG